MAHTIAPRTFVTMLAVTLLLSVAATAQVASPACSLARAAGNYGFSDSGTVIGVGPRVAVGVLTLDAAGNLVNGKATSSLNGTISDEAFSGIYTVNSDCTGSFAIKIFDPSGNVLLTVTGDLTWDDNMKQLRLIFKSATLPGGGSLLTVISGDGRKLVP